MDEEQPERLKSQYVNHVQFTFGVYDFTLEFARVDDPHAEPPTLATVARVQMSPQHTKVMALMLLKNLAAYEHQMGIIELPAGLLQELKISNLQHFISQVNLIE